MKPPRLFRFLFALLSGASLAQAQSASFKGEGLKTELVSEVTAVRPGQPFYAGLFIQHDPHQHTYWKNPGLLGVETSLEWTLPEGWQAGAIEWPAPDKVKMAVYDTHGFERDVLLMVKITPPASVKDKTVTLKTKAAWMCCGELCTPGFCDLTLTLPVEPGTAASLDPKWQKAFSQERANFPVPVTGWKFSATRAGDKVILTGEPEKQGPAVPESPVFYSSDNLICSNPPQKWSATPTGFKVELTLATEKLPKDQSALRGLLRGKTGWNKDDARAVIIEVPLK